LSTNSKIEPTIYIVLGVYNMGIPNGRMRRGWIVELEDGITLWECDTEWVDVPKKKIKSLTLLFEGRKWKIEGKSAYIQKKRGSVAPGERIPTIEQRIIGYYEGNTKIEYVVNEYTGNMVMRVLD
jgi:hypothetical protein